MRDRLSLLVRLSSYAVILFGYLSLASVRGYGVVMLAPPLLFFLLAPVGERLEAHHAWYRNLKLAACITYGCFIPLSVIQLGLMNAVIALVIFIQGYLLAGPKSEKIYFQLYLMSFFLLLAAVVQSPEPAIALVLAGYIVSVIWAFTSLRIHADRAGAGRFKAMLVVVRDGKKDLRAGNVFDAGLFFALLLLSVSAVALTVVLFMAIPRVEAGLLGRTDPGRAVTGLSESVLLTGGMSIYEDPTAVMHVEFPEEPGGMFTPASGLYWRTTTLSRFSGSEWTRRGLEDHLQPQMAPLFGRATPRNLQSAGREEERTRIPGARLVRQNVFMDDVSTGALPCLDLVQRVTVGTEAERMTVQWDSGLDFTVQLNARNRRTVAYTALSEVFRPTVEDLRAASMDYSGIPPRDYSLLTYHELLPSTLGRVEQVVAGAETAYDKIQALNDWLSGPDFAYTLDLPPLPQTNAIDYFINAARRGHCELFASALALMARSQGIPTRVVSGYRGGDWSASSRSYTVRASMAHLWVEACFPGIGWVRFDPSPASDMTMTGLNRLRMAWSRQLLQSKMFWYQSVMGFEGGWRLDRLFAWRRSNTHAAGSGPGIGVPEPLMNTGGGFSFGAGFWIAMVLSGLVVLYGAWRLAEAFRRRPAKLTPDQARAVRLYREFVRRMERTGFSCAGKTAEEIAAAAAGMPGFPQETVAGVVNAYHDARFGGRPLPPPLAARLRNAMRTLGRRTAQ
ncbi:MAG: DUF3488 domain-containing protein [Candidatus Hydrogenedentes bacterium]|nr:DUF3488 domain-containing protein [Candidatus Hydrogenedentota bacterium]